MEVKRRKKHHTHIRKPHSTALEQKIRESLLLEIIHEATNDEA